MFQVAFLLRKGVYLKEGAADILGRQRLCSQLRVQKALQTFHVTPPQEQAHNANFYSAGCGGQVQPSLCCAASRAKAAASTGREVLITPQPRHAHLLGPACHTIRLRAPQARLCSEANQLTPPCMSWWLLSTPMPLSVIALTLLGCHRS